MGGGVGAAGHTSSSFWGVVLRRSGEIEDLLQT